MRSGDNVNFKAAPQLASKVSDMTWQNVFIACAICMIVAGCRPCIGILHHWWASSGGCHTGFGRPLREQRTGWRSRNFYPWHSWQKQFAASLFWSFCKPRLCTAMTKQVWQFPSCWLLGNGTRSVKKPQFCAAVLLSKTATWGKSGGWKKYGWQKDTNVRIFFWLLVCLCTMPYKQLWGHMFLRSFPAHK